MGNRSNMRMKIPATLVLVLLFSMVAGIQCVKLTSANFMPPQPQHPSIYIRSDGAVEPQTVLIQRVQDTYTLTEDIVNFTIEIQRDNIVLDGAGYTLDGGGIGKGIRIANVSDVTAKNVEIKGFATGIDLHNSAGNTFTKINIRGCDIGIAIHESSNNQILENYMEANNAAILFYTASNNSIIENTLTKNRDGIWCEGTTPRSDYNSIIGNNITQNANYGILLRSTVYNRIEANTITNNSYGLMLSGCSNSTFFHNNFIDNTQSVASFGSSSIWDNGKEGNYWSDYNGTDINGDDVGDTAYSVEAQSTWTDPVTSISRIRGVNTQDNYPLMKPFRASESPSEDNSTEATLSSKPFPTTLIATASAVTVAVVAGLLVYLKKHHWSRNL